MIRGVVIAAILIGGVVLLPLSQLTDSDAERYVKEKLGIVEEPCGTTTASPGWAEGPDLPDSRDEPRAVAVGDRIYLVGGIRAITEYGKPSTVPGVPEHVEVESIRSLTEFDPRTGRYTELPPLPEGLNHVGFVAHDGALWVVGGHGRLLFGADPRSDLYRFDLETRRWEEKAPMPTPRGGGAVGVIDGTMYVAGGMSAGRALDTVEAYDFATDRWREVASLPASREHIAGAVADGRFYVIGGRGFRDDSLAEVTRYDPERDAWEEVAPLPKPSGGLEAVAFDGAVVAMGGGDDRERWVTGAVQRFDPDTEEWTQLAEMRTPRHGFAAAVVGDEIWSFGGSPCALFQASRIAERFRPPRT